MSLRTPDLTTKQRAAGPGMCTRLLWLCGHKAPREPREPGVLFRGRVPMRCAKCARVSA